MSANGKATEPSMDDILASIRRIIAEEPKPGAAPATRSVEVGARSAEPGTRSAEPAPMRLSDDTPAAPTTAAIPTPAASTMPLPTPKPAAAWGSLGAAPAAAPPLASLAPLAPPPTVAPPVPAGAAAKPTASGSFGDDLASLIGAVRASANIAGVPAVPPAASMPPPPASTPPATDAAAPRPIAFANTPLLHVATSPIAAEARARGTEAALFGASTPKQTIVNHSETTAAPTAVVSPPELDAMPRSAVEPVAAGPARPAPELAQLGTSKPSTAEPAAPARPAVAVTTPASASASTAPTKVAVARTMEDAVAEMLRPLLRDWLDENMPKIVEKAMKAELADREQRKTGQKPN